MYIEDKFKAANGLHDIYWYIWEPEVVEDAVGIVQISHGMKEYGVRYEDFATFLTNKGYIVCTSDHAGHGKSVGDTYGYMGEPDGHLSMVEDLHTVMDKTKELYGSDVEYYMLGHSMGSFVARLFASAFGDELTGLLLSGTAGPNSFISLGKAACKVMLKAKGGKAPSLMIDSMSQKNFNKRIDKSEQKYGIEWISTDKKVQEEYANNPLNMFPFTFAGYYDIVRMMDTINRKEWFESLPKDLDVFLFAGLEDPVGDYGKGVMEVYMGLQRAGLKNVKLRLYDGMRHEVLNEVDKEDVYEDVLKWLETRQVDFN